MGKYSNTFDVIYSVMGSTAWKQEGIPTFPENYVGGGSEFIRVSVRTGLARGLDANSSTQGQLIIDIYTASNMGVKRSLEIADALDRHFSTKIIEINSYGNVQFSGSSLSMVGTDPVDANLHRAAYTISFTYFGK